MSLPHLILGLLYRQPDSGYDLNKRFEMTVAHFWTTDQSQIYRTLYKLRDRGWVAVHTVVQEGNPNKKIYSITEAGQQELVDWLQKPLDDDVMIRDAPTGQVFFGDALEIDKLLEVQTHYVQRIREKLDIYYGVEETFFASLNFDELPFGWTLGHATLQYGIRALELEVQWREDLIERIKTRQQLDDKKGD